MQEDTFERPDGRLVSYRIEGAGLPVLWFEGTPGSRIAWHVPDGVQLLGFDRAGYGGSAPLPGRTVMDSARDAVALLDHLGWDSCHLGGWSNGGPHALATASLLGDRCKGVIALASASPFDSDLLDESKQERAATIAADPHAYRARLDGLASAVHADPLPTMTAGAGEVVPARDLEVLQRFAARADEALREATAQGAAGWFEDHVALSQHDEETPDQWHVDWSAVTCPVVFLHGELDTICPLDAVESLAAHLPHALVEGDPQDGHLAPLLRLDDAIARHWR